jgi:protein FAM32A
MSDDPFTFVKGGLKLKNGLSISGGGIKKPGGSSGSSRAPTRELALSGDALKSGGGSSAPSTQASFNDKRTAAERAHDERLAAKEAKDAAKAAATTHRQKVAAFNEHLAKLSEHHDIPRVGPG